MNHTITRLFGEFTKTEQAPEGLYVAGVASTETRDDQGELVKASAMKKALGRYFTPGLTGEVSGPVREMHQLSAVGKTIAAEVDAKGATHIETIIVDPVAAAKVRAGVYKGFSIGGRVPPGGRSKTDPTVIEDLVLSEISLVDRPCNPGATFTVFKADGVGDGPDAISKVAAERDDAIAKLALAERRVGVLTATLGKVQAERNALRDRLTKAVRRRDADAAEIEKLIKERDVWVAKASVKGSLRALPVSKIDDTGTIPIATTTEPDVRSLIRRAHMRPTIW